MNYAELSGQRISRGEIEIPYYGAATGDVSLAHPEIVPTSGMLTLSDLSLSVTTYRTDSFAGSRTARLVGGRGGWLAQVPAQSYYNPGGVLMSLVLGDLAMVSGETVALAADVSLGPYFVREAARASRILAQLAGYNWFVDGAGVTQVGATRSGAVITSAYTVTSYDGGRGVAVVATEALADWQPGRTFSAPGHPGALTVSSVRHVIREGLVRSEIQTQPSVDRLYAPWQQVTRETDPARTFANVYEYTVQATDGTTADLQLDASGVPVPTQLAAMPLRVGLPGFAVKAGVGSTVLVAFANGDPTKPRVIAYDGATAAIITYNGGTRIPVCYGDSVSVGASAGAITTADIIALARRVNA